MGSSRSMLKGSKSGIMPVSHSSHAVAASEIDLRRRGARHLARRYFNGSVDVTSIHYHS